MSFSDIFPVKDFFAPLEPSTGGGSQYRHRPEERRETGFGRDLGQVRQEEGSEEKLHGAPEGLPTKGIDSAQTTLATASNPSATLAADAQQSAPQEGPPRGALPDQPPSRGILRFGSSPNETQFTGLGEVRIVDREGSGDGLTNGAKAALLETSVGRFRPDNAQSPQPQSEGANGIPLAATSKEGLLKGTGTLAVALLRPAPNAKADFTEKSRLGPLRRPPAAPPASFIDPARPGQARPANAESRSEENDFRLEADNIRDAAERNSASSRAYQTAARAESPSRAAPGPAEAIQAPTANLQRGSGIIPRLEAGIIETDSILGGKPSEGVFRQIVESARLMKMADGASFELRLKPAFLGRLRIETSVAGDDRVSARFLVEDPEVRSLIQARLELLAERLGAAGVRVHQLEVGSLSTHSQDATPHQREGRHTPDHGAAGRRGSQPQEGQQGPSDDPDKWAMPAWASHNRLSLLA